MAETQFASLDAATMFGAGSAYPPDSANIARRSVSIFSRRGTETPEPRPLPITQVTSIRAPRPLTERQKSWVGGTKSIRSSPRSPKSSTPQPGSSLRKGTILNAVPPAKTIQMTALEEEMATSPNEEIISAISEHSTLSMRFPALAQPATDSFSSNNLLPLIQRTVSTRQRDEDTRIGVWVDGIVHWDEGAVARQQLGTIVGKGMASVPVLPDRSSHRPQLSVIIPGSGPRANDANESSIPPVLQPRPRSTTTRATSGGIESRFSVSFPTGPESVTDMSHIDSDSDAPTTPQTRIRALDQTKGERSRASTASSTYSDERSVCSHRSSATSVDAATPPALKEKKRHHASMPLPLSSEPEGASCNGATRRGDVNKPLPPAPIPGLRTYHDSRVTPLADKSKRRVQSSKSIRTLAVAGSLSPVKRIRQSRSMTELDRCDLEFLQSSPYQPLSADNSPTLSQAEEDLHAHLSTLSDNPRDGAAEVDASALKPEVVALSRSDSVRSVMQPPERAPTIPRRSRKREWRGLRSVPASEVDALQGVVRRKSESAAPFADVAVAPERRLRKSHSVLTQFEPQPSDLRDISVPAKGEGTSPAKDSNTCDNGPDIPQIVIDDGLVVVRGPTIEPRWDEKTAKAVSSASAEEVLLHILSTLHSLGDLFHTAVMNKGMYRVFKENEMDLIRAVAYNESPSAWEVREWHPPQQGDLAVGKASSQLEHTPSSYVHCHRRDVEIIGNLKMLVLEHCRTFIRRETLLALSLRESRNAQRFDDAIWRIWCFCRIFGSDRGREDDITGQLDWLKGGLLANNQCFSATVNTNLDFELSSVLLNAPEHFAKGNAGGLTAAQLFDLTEIWTCMASLLQGYQGRVDQARQNGVFDGLDVEQGDLDHEEHMLEEWIAYLLTLGPAVVLEMAKFASDSSCIGFARAREQGWTKWTPPMYNTTRTNFFKEPVARTYEERVAAATARLQDPREQEKKEMSRKRVATLAAEIRLRRQCSTYRRLPLIDMSTERPMSMVARRGNSIASQRSLAAGTVSSLSSPSLRSRFSPGSALSPTTSLWNALPRRISPIIEDRVESFNRLTLQNFADGIAEDTSTRAVAKIVALGFSDADAKAALKMTDMGDGLRVDRALELLLRR